MSEWQKMREGLPFDTFDPDLLTRRALARSLCEELNTTASVEVGKRRKLLEKMFGSGGDTVDIESPFFCDYGSNIELGKAVSFNFNCVVLDVCRVIIGEHTLIGPGVKILTPEHSFEKEARHITMHGKPVTIGKDVWIAGGAIILPGVTIGDGAVIGAGSVVARNIEAGYLAYGNPCKKIRKVEDRTQLRQSVFDYLKS